MKHLTMKQSVRREKKKKKMAAFLEIAKLNDMDREARDSKLHTMEKSAAESSDSDNAMSEKMPQGEPSRKRARKNELMGDGVGKHNAMEMATEKPIEADPCTFSTPVTPEQVSAESQEGEHEFDEDWIEMRRQLRERQKLTKNIPSFRLKQSGELASIDLNEDDRTPLFLSDIQHLLLYSILGNSAPYNPLGWCHVEKAKNISQTAFLLVEGISLYDFMAYESCFPSLSSCFSMKVEVITPSAYNGNFIEELSLVPLTHAKEIKLLKKYESIENALRVDGEIHKVLRSMFPVIETDKTGTAIKSDPDFTEHVNEMSRIPPLPRMPQYTSLAHNDQFPRTNLIMSVAQLMEHNFPIPLKGPLKEKYKNYVLTKDLYAEVTPQSPMYALDCEMCMTTDKILELTRISIVDEHLNCMYDSLVMPYNRITNYLTQYSGITKEMLASVTKRLEDVQEDIRRLLPMDAILIGQSLNGDLHTLRMMHPYVIDTSVIFNVTGNYKRKSKLSVLSMRFLGEQIQMNSKGHCSTEDSEACMKLVQLKLANTLAFGDTVLAYQQPEYRSITQSMVTLASPEIISAWQEASQNHHTVELQERNNQNNNNDNLEHQEHLASSMFSYFKNHDKSVAIVSTRDIIDQYNVWINSRLTPHRKRGKKSVECMAATSKENVVLKMGSAQNKHALTIGHLVYNSEKLDRAVNKEEIFREIDSWCEKVWERMSTNGLCMIMFGGRLGGANGVCFMRLKNRDTSFIYRSND